jgi:hypothetical protein
MQSNKREEGRILQPFKFIADIVFPNLIRYLANKNAGHGITRGRQFEIDQRMKPRRTNYELDLSRIENGLSLESEAVVKLKGKNNLLFVPLLVIVWSF